MKKTKQQSKKLTRKMTFWIVGGIVVAAIIATIFALFIGKNTLAPQSSDSSDAAKFKSEYSNVDADNRFVYASDDEILDIMNNGSGIVFLGFPECPWCQQLAPIVDEAARAENLDKIYYLNIRESRANNDATYQQLLEKLKDYVGKDDDGNPRILVPDVTAVRDGEIVGRFKQEATADGETATPTSYWTDERRERAVQQFREMIAETREFAAVQDEVKNNGALLLDVRTSAEFESGHFANANNFSVEKMKNGGMPNVDKNTTIYVYCRSGNRSAQAAALLKNAGFTNVKDLGGLDDVVNIGGVLEK